MWKLGQKVIVVDDKFEQNLPVGEYGYIIAYDRNPDNAFDYVVRIPKVNKNFFVPGSDLELEELLVQEEIDRIEREALIDFALATHNEALFKRIMNGDANEEEVAEGHATITKPEDFVRQINLKAWI
ncbi:ATPase [Paenibacillus sp. GCM10012307]|uniref:ATPase n=1 Tax=Paenibacillus roseus TaxID=2798579 RepID=A0A934J694_9BACL|nr:ATPase [Paenibacillus roseus]MBJ6361536.1 ATPase [Paenibacillus roseus]